MSDMPELGSAEWWRLIAEGRGEIMAEYRAERDEARRQLAEAAACVRGLIALNGKLPEWITDRRDEFYMAEYADAYRALPAWLRREIEE